MPYLRIQRLDGTTENRELSRTHQLSVGRQTFNDLCVPEADVQPFHCRIGWNKSSFEITAATSLGVEVNSTSVAHVNLKQGDVIRIGSLDLIFEEAPFPASNDDSKSQITFAPAPAIPTAAIPASSIPKKPKPTVAPIPAPVEELSSFEGEVLMESDDSLESPPVLMRAGSRGHAVSKPDRRREKEESGRPANRKRPGEEEVIKSPLVLGLTFGGLALLLITGIFWFLISREQATHLYERAVAELQGGQYLQSIASFEKFLAQNPRHGMRRPAERGLGEANIMKEISGGAPSWKRGLERLNEYIRDHRSEPDFAEMHPTLFRIADQISLGAAKSAETVRDPEFLAISKEAQSLIERYADPAAPPVGTIGRISEQRVKAERAIEKQRTFDQAMSVVDQAIANGKPMDALSERERLVRLFPEFSDSKRVKESLKKSLELEKSVVSIDETEIPAERTDETPPKPEPILPYSHVRSRTDESAQGRLVYVVAKDSCYAIDSLTGELAWRRVVGLGTPFFPVTIAGAQSSLLLFDTRKQALVACQTATGKLIWSQPLKAQVIGSPLVHEGQIYQPIEGRSLVRIDVDSGRISARVKFSQNLATSPTLSRDGTHLIVPGEMAMIYSLSLRSTSTLPALSVVATTFTDHAAGAVVAPPLSLGRLLLICENDRADSARLRLWDAGNPTQSLTELDSARTNGQVRDVPVLRGNQLVVPSTGEQFAAFAVTDDAGRAGISPIGQYRADQARMSDQLNAPLFVALGADGQFWSAGTAFRRFEIASDSIRMDSNSTAAGIASQPLQMEGDYFFVGRKPRFTDAVTFSAIDREKLVSPWRCIVGDTPLELLATRDEGIFWVGESGSLYTLGKNRLMQGGGDSKAGTDIDLPANILKPIRATALHDQRMVVSAVGDTKTLILFNNSGQLTTKYPLPDLLEADPVLLDDGLVLPLPGRLKYLPLSSTKKSVQDWIDPVGEVQQHRWAYLVRIDDREFIACESSGRLSRIQLRQGDAPHLAEVAKLQLDHPIDVRPILRGDSLYLADSAGNCRQLNVRSFDIDGQRQFAPPIRRLWSVDKTTLISAGDGKLYCLADGKALPENWTFEINQLEPIGQAIIEGDSVWIGCRDGTILVLNAKTGAVTRRINLPQSLSLGVRRIKDTMIAVAVDGTIYRIEQ